MTDLVKLENSDYWDYSLPYTVLERLDTVAAVFNQYGFQITLTDYSALFNGYNTDYKNAKAIVNGVESNIDAVCTDIDFLFPNYDSSVKWNLTLPQTNGLNRWIDTINALYNIAEFISPAPIGLKYDDETIIKYDADTVVYYPQMLNERI